MLAIRIPITLASIETIKSHLRRALPQVKSSHRVEAAARSLGFRTYAAILSAASSNEARFGVVDGGRFLSYLRDHQQHVDAIHIYRSAAWVALSAVMHNEWRLSMRGYGFGQPRWIPDERRWQTSAERYADFTENRAGFLSDEAMDEFLRALALIQRISPTKTIRNGTGSYRLKHLAEKITITLPDGRALGPDYVSNGALIAAALHAGFKMKTHRDDFGYDHVNVIFNMPKKAVDDLDSELRPGRLTAKTSRLTGVTKNLVDSIGANFACP